MAVLLVPAETWMLQTVRNEISGEGNLGLYLFAESKKINSRDLPGKNKD